jgi:membrane protein DedA with SNARE-associated domain
VSADQQALTETIRFVERHGYALLFGWVLAEQGAIPLPSIPLLLAAGSLARGGRLQFGLALAACVGAALVADMLWFELGRRRGTRVLRWLCRVSLEPDSCVRITENTFSKYGLRALLVSKFVPGLNAVAAPLAGNSGSPVGQFLFYDLTGAAIWSGTYLALGYIFSEQLETVLTYASGMGSGLLLLVVALFALWIGWKFLQRRRFLRNLNVARITPAELRGLLDSGQEPYIVDLRGSIDDDPSPIPHSVRLSIEDLSAGRHKIPRSHEIILFCT